MKENILPIKGLRLAALNVGIKQTERPDFCLIEAAPGSNCAAVFTQNRFAAAPVQLAKQHLGNKSAPRYLLVNAGNANCGTGEGGIQDAEQLCARVAGVANCETDEVLPFSTGVIGERLPLKKMKDAVETLYTSLSEDAWQDAAKAIMTTDTRPKIFTVCFEAQGTQYTLTGIAKGAGMIKPNMATMLSFIATDANVEANSLQRALEDSVSVSFNRVTIDGDTSTNDAAILFAVGAQDTPQLRVGAADWENFEAALEALCVSLAKAIVADGEGATKFVEVEVVSPSLSMSETIAYTVAESPLVKTALFAGDPNWGRILAAVGRAPVQAFDIADVSIFLGDYQIVAAGSVVDNYEESKAAEVMAQDEIRIRVIIGSNGHSCRVWTTDLSYDYVKINAEYRS